MFISEAVGWRISFTPFWVSTGHFVLYATWDLYTCKWWLREEKGKDIKVKEDGTYHGLKQWIVIKEAWSRSRKWRRTISSVVFKRLNSRLSCPSSFYFKYQVNKLWSQFILWFDMEQNCKSQKSFVHSKKKEENGMDSSTDISIFYFVNSMLSAQDQCKVWMTREEISL